MLGYHPEVILAGRRINDGMGKFIAEQTVKNLVRNGWQVKDAPIIVLGLTFKEDCPDPVSYTHLDVYKRQALGRADGNVHKAAEMLGVSRLTLYDLMHRFGMK